MTNDKTRFRHQSLQDRKSVQSLLKAITKGIAKGNLEFRDEEGEITLLPEGLLNLKVTARREGSRDRLDIQVSWHSEEAVGSDGKLVVNGKE